MDVLKLFVVGQKSSDPGEWSPLSDYAIVLASDKDEAIRLSQLPSNAVAEIPLSIPMVLSVVESPAADWPLI